MPASFSELSTDITNAFTSLELGELFRQDNKNEWDQVLQSLSFIPVFYSHASIEYQLAYQRGHGGVWHDISIILVHGSRPCGVWPISFSINDEVSRISSQGMLLMPPLFISNLAEKSRKAVTKKCQALLEKLCKIGGIPEWESAESYAGAAEKGLSEWHLQSMTLGASASLSHEIFVDLSLDISDIKSYFRKSYKPLINVGLRTWKVAVLAEENSAIWNEFKALHFNVSGRVTRSSETWDLQHKAIVEGDAFLVFLRDENDEMVGGGFFYITRDQGLYGVGAYDRALFDKPLGHVVQFRAIEEMKQRGLRWYKIGRRIYPVDSVDKKEISISEFKQGFATHFFSQYIIRYEID